MKIIRASFAALILFPFITTNLFAASEKYTLDPKHSYVLWSINHFGFSNQVGKWYVGEGNLVIDKEKIQNSKVSVSIPMANLVTGIPELDKHLKGKLFFDVDQFPIATFESNKVVAKNNKISQVYGILKLHGVTKPVVLNISFNNEGVNPLNNKMTIGFAANSTIKRSDFGINTLLPGLGDDVKVDIVIEATQVKK